MNLAKKSIEDVDINGKRVLMRVDFDIPMSETGDILDNQRILVTIPTIKSIIDRGAKSLVLMSHLGSSFGSKQRPSLAPVARLLESLLKEPVLFLADRIGDEVEAACADPVTGSIILLENLNFYAEEEGKDIAHDQNCNASTIEAKREDVELFRARLDALGDIYVNEAFRFAYQTRSSIIGVDLPEMVSGLLLKSELDACFRILSQPVRPLVAILGGARLSCRLDILESMICRCDTVIVCGLMAFALLKICHSVHIGSNPCHAKDEELARSLVEKARSKGCELVFPVDWVCGQFGTGEIKESLETALFTSEQGIPEGWMGMDIGPKSTELFVSRIFAAKTVLWDGAPGHLDVDYFAKGTQVLFDAVISLRASGGFAFISSNDLANFSAKWNLQESVSFISSGCETCSLLFEGRKLEGIALLTDKSRPLAWQGTAVGKYAWEDANATRVADDDTNCSQKISKYSWSDGKKRVSIYIEMDGADDLMEEAFKVHSGSNNVSLAIESASGKRTFELAGLSQEIIGARVVQKKDKNLLALYLQKKEEKEWSELLASPSASANNDDT